MKYNKYSRRKFLEKSALVGVGTAFSMSMAPSLLANKISKEPIIDIHQHANYGGRSTRELIDHQRAMGITTTILLPAGRPVISASTHNGASNGLGGETAGSDACFQIAQQYPGEFFFGANDVPDQPGTIGEIEKYLKMGAKVIGESKFGVECDSPEMQKVYQLAQEYDVPVLMHWQHGRYNHGFERFHKMLEKYPKVNFIGHAQTWWANIDKNHTDQTVMYPKTEVTPGGLTDRLLSDYPNMYGDMSAGSGLNSLLRDEDHARGFIERHQDKLLYGSDCNDAIGHGQECQGARTIAAVRRLSPSKEIERKLLYNNSKRLFRL
jgi:predicted TIM-barrel fold metal-dependent hydrolase